MALSFSMKVGNLFIFVILLFVACVEPIDLPVIENSAVLVVDGMITDQEGTHSVKLFYSSALDENVGEPVPVTGALVSIIDDLGNNIVLGEHDDGIYETAGSTHGTVGVTYKLRIVLDDGVVYESTPAMMASAGTLDAVEHRFKENVINQHNLTKPQDAVYLYLDATAPEESRLLRWRWKATYNVETHPELITKVENRDRIPNPPECSGYIEEGHVLVYKQPCTCCECWPVLHGDASAVSQPQNVGDRTFVMEYIGRIPFEHDYFFPKLIVEVEQLSVSEDVHRFWSLLKVQIEGAGNIFQPNIVKVRGNIRRLDKPDENVFGVFSVSAMVSATYTIHDYDLPKPVFLPDTVIADCRQFTKGSNQRPPFW
jgi:hypothetical protein